MRNGEKIVPPGSKVFKDFSDMGTGGGPVLSGFF